MKKLFFALALTFAIIASSTAQTLVPFGPSAIYADRDTDFSILLTGGDLSDYVYIVWDFVGETFEWSGQHCGFGCYNVTPTSTGVGNLWVRLIAPDHTVEGYMEVTVVAAPQLPPQPPLPPTITGESSVGIYDVEAYTMPSGKDDYEWTLPYGVSHMQEYGSTKVVQFTSTGNRTIQGKYKEDGEWSSVGYKSVSVSY